jgi:hypothetical protein
MIVGDILFLFSINRSYRVLGYSQSTLQSEMHGSRKIDCTYPGSQSQHREASGYIETTLMLRTRATMSMQAMPAGFAAHAGSRRQGARRAFAPTQGMRKDY